MRQIWDKRGYYYKEKKGKPINTSDQNFEETITVSEWENTLGKLVLGKQPGNDLAKELADDKGLTIIKDMVFNFRASVLVSMLKLTTRLLRLSVGEALFDNYINDFFDNTYPDLLPVKVAEQFAVYAAFKKYQSPVPAKSFGVRTFLHLYRHR